MAAEYTSKLDRLSDEQRSLEASNDVLRREIQEIDDQISDLEDNRDDLRRGIDDNETRIAEIKAELAAMVEAWNQP